MASLKLLIILTFTSFSALSWSPKFRAELNQLVKKSRFDAPPSYTTVWAGLKRIWNRGDVKAEPTEFELPSVFKNKEIEIYSSFTSKDKPLVVYLPGMFGNASGKISEFMISHIEKRGVNLLVLPNFLGKKFIEADPLYSETCKLCDIEASFKLFKAFMEKNRDKFSKRVHILAESLGSYVGLNLLDYSKKDKALSNYDFEITLLWPPLDVSDSVNRLNTYIKDSKETYDSCFMLYRKAQAIYYFIYKDFPHKAPKDFVKCFNTYFYRVNITGVMEKSFETFEDSHRYKEVTEEPEEFNFDIFFKLYNPKLYQTLQSKGEELFLGHWLKKLKDHPIQIISSTDDMINDSNKWSELSNKFHFDAARINLLSWGAHCAILSLDGFYPILFSELKL